MRRIQVLAIALIAAMATMAQSKVYFTKEISPEACMSISEAR